MNTLAAALSVAAAATWLLIVARSTLVAARMLQIEEYESARFLAWGRNGDWLVHPAAVTGVVCVAATIVTNVVSEQATVVVAGAWLLAGLCAHLLWRWTPVKRALVFTARMKRLLGAAALIVAAVGAAATVGVIVSPRLTAPFVALLALAVTALPVLALASANQAMRPAERAVRNHYLNRARRCLAELRPLTVAVAGSYGKTSTKHILAHLLGGDDVLPTRKSFNTLMGVTRVVNEDLTATHRVFIVEMDAYARGEIAAICRLVHPQYAVVTSVGPQHLERFGTMSAIEDALYETIAELPPEGTAVVHLGDDGGRALAARARSEGRTVVTYGLADTPDADVVASDVQSGSGGTAFTWTWMSRHLVRDVGIPLLGRHQALNVTAALAVVELLGRDLDAAVQAAGTLQPVEHRLQRLETGGAVTVIDDSYNANPVGVHEGLDVLAGFDGGAKILVTPGLVELGSVEEAENRRYGEHAAAVCDQVIVAEARPAAALVAGLRAGGLPAERIHSVRNLAETTALLARLARPGDVVLFANDLPDTYLSGPGARATTVTTTGAGG